MTGRVGTSQTDSNGRMKLVSAIDLIQDCSFFWMETEPSFRDFLSGNGLGMFLLSRQADIVRLPEYGEKLRAVTLIFECKGFYGHRCTAIYDEGGSACVLTWSLGAFVGIESGAMTRLSDDVLKRVRLDPRLDMEYLGRKIKPPGAGSVNLPPVPVRRNDIDMYGHMNNVRYLEAAMECLPGGFEVKRFRVEYKTPAKSGDLLTPSLVCEGGRVYVTLLGEAGRPYTVFEFSG